MSGKRRGVAFCVNSECDCFAKLRSYRHLPDEYDCPRCGPPGHVERERGSKHLLLVVRTSLHEAPQARVLFNKAVRAMTDELQLLLQHHNHLVIHLLQQHASMLHQQLPQS